MTTYDIALIGFGGVNRTLAELVATRGDTLRSELGFGLRVVAITDLRLGSLVQPEGIDLGIALNLDGGSETFAAHGDHDQMACPHGPPEPSVGRRGKRGLCV